METPSLKMPHTIDLLIEIRNVIYHNKMISKECDESISKTLKIIRGDKTSIARRIKRS